ncbi:MAG: hypothetical protein WBY22_09225 [Nitrososphaeraceae archaeon]
MRRTRLMIEAENNRILDYMIQGASDRQIRKWLRLSPRNYEKRIKDIRESHMHEILDKQKVKAMASLLQLSIEKIQALELQANVIISNATTKDEVRLQAMDRVRQYAIDIAKLYTEGPTIFQVIPRDGFHAGLKKTTSEAKLFRWVDVNENADGSRAESETETETEFETEDSNRVC